MSTYRQILYHIVFRTYKNQKTLKLQYDKELYLYIFGIIKNKGCFLYRINGMEDHIHILSDLHPSIALADYMRDIKTATSIWLKENKNYPNFKGWAEGYAAFTCGFDDKENLVNYIKNQREHHKSYSFDDEYRSLMLEYGIVFNEKYFLK